MKSNLPVGPSEPTGPGQIVFRPQRGRVVTMTAGAIFFWLLGAFVFWIPFGVAPGRPERGIVLMMAGLCDFMALLGTWLLLLANRTRRSIMVADDRGLRLRASGDEWFIWNPWNVREARLGWDEIQGVRYRVLPGVGEPLRQYVLETTRGRFSLSSFVWPDVDAMAALICRRTGLRVASSTAELPAGVAERARPGRGGRAAVWAIRAFGWFCLLFGGLAAAAFAAVLLTGQEFKGSLAGALLAVLFLMATGNALRNFRVE